MIRVTTWTAACALAATLMATAGPAAAQLDMCPPQGRGVPWQDGPPVWRDFTGGGATTCPATGAIDCNFDDPRWRGAAALTYNSASGSANPPVQFRTLWAPDGSRALYMQWLVRIAVSDTSGAARGNAHDVFFGFERPDPGVLAEGDQRGWMVRLHLGPAGTVADELPARPGTQDIRRPSKCPTTSTCDDNADYFQVFSNFQAAGGQPNTDTTGTCTSLSGASYIFTALDADPLWLKNSIQYERVCTGTTQDTCNLWVVSVRVPLIPAASPTRAAEIHMDGIEEVAGTAVPGFWYQVNFSAWDPDPADPFNALLTAKLDGWPRSDAADVAGTGDSLCTTGGVFYKDVDSDAGTGMGSGPEPWAPLRPWNGFSARPAGCFDGITLTPDDIGVLTRDFSAAAPSDATILASAPDTTFKAYNTTTYPPPNTSPRARNTVFARPRNPTGTPITDVKLKARFRLAHWGAQPWATPAPEAVWTDLPGSTDSGVCAATPSGGLCGNVTIPAGAPPGNAGLIKLEWTIGGDDATVDANEAIEFCKFGIDPPSTTGFSCGACTTSDGKPGKQLMSGGSPTGPPCTRALWNHQCMIVELDADSAANFENASVYQNMDVQGMSETSREAMISVRGMPVIAGARDEEVYLVVMPRNMPASLPAATTGTTFVQQNAAAARDALMAPYLEAAREMPPALFGSLIDGVGGNTYGGGELDPVIYETPEQFPQADLPDGARLMPRGSRAVAEFLDGASRYNGRAEDLTMQMIDSLDNITATAILPTLDVYAFRRDKGKRLVPMTSFTLIVHHEGPLAGITWEIDGATRLAHNLFKVEMPVGHRRRINIRVMAREHAQDHQRRGNEKWPCTTGGCCKPCVMSEPDFALGNGAPLLIVGAVIAVRRRRKAKDAAKR